jgi:hypothetical protein
MASRGGGPRFEARGAWCALWLCGYLTFDLDRSDFAKNGLDPSSTEVSGPPCSNGTLPNLAEPVGVSFTGRLRSAPHLPFQAVESTSRHPILNKEQDYRLCNPVAADMLAQGTDGDVGSGAPIGPADRRLGAIVSSSSLLHEVRRDRNHMCGLSQHHWVIFHRKGAVRTCVDRPKRKGRHFWAVDAPREHPFRDDWPSKILGKPNGIVRAPPGWNGTAAERGRSRDGVSWLAASHPANIQGMHPRWFRLRSPQHDCQSFMACPSWP